jgi:hypothetical protein
VHIASASELNQAHQPTEDDALMVRFFVKAREDQRETAKQGRPVFKDTEYIEIRTPGKRDSVCRPARKRDIDRFPRHYEAFKARTSQEVATGTPLVEWPQVSRSLAEELSFFNVKTVEQLASMPDSQTSQFMGGGMLKQKARKWLEISEAAAKANELKEALAKRDKEIEELKAAVAALQKPAATKRPAKKKAVRKKAAAKKE